MLSVWCWFGLIFWLKSNFGLMCLSLVILVWFMIRIRLICVWCRKGWWCLVVMVLLILVVMLRFVVVIFIVWLIVILNGMRLDDDGLIL